jgi:hypothetical protein
MAIVWPDRNFLQQRLHVGPDDAIRLELRRHHVAVEEGHGEQVRQAVVRRSLVRMTLSTPYSPPAGEVVAELEHLCLNRDHLAGVDLVPLDKLGHAVDRRLRVDHRVVLFYGALHDTLVPLRVPRARRGRQAPVGRKNLSGSSPVNMV